MPSLTIRDLPAPLHERLRARAERNRRSLNAEVVHTLEEAVRLRPLDVEARLVELRALRTSAEAPPLTAELLREADAGRP